MLAAWSGHLAAMQIKVSKASNFPEVMRTVLETALKLMPNADGVGIGFRHGEELHLVEAVGTLWPSRGLRLPLPDTLSRHCLENNEAASFSDAESDPRLHPHHFQRFQSRSGIIVPIPFDGESIGVLVFHSRIKEAFGSYEHLIAQVLVGPLSSGFSSASRTVAERELSVESKRFAATFEQAAVGIAHVATDGSFILVNDKFCDIAGHPRSTLLTQGFQAITHPDDLEVDMGHVQDLLDGKAKTYALEKRYIREDHRLVWVNLTVSLVRDDEGRPDFFVAVIEDITARKNAESDAFHDPLTDLLNRRGIMQSLENVLARRRKSEMPMAVAYFDLDKFKAVNDTFGHAEGDRCLIKVSRAIRSCLRSNDIIGRLGGDEFLALLPCVDEAAAQATIKRLFDAIEDVARGEAWDLGASAGVALLAEDTTLTPIEVVNMADRLMYRAKRCPDRNCVIQSCEQYSKVA